MKRIIIAGPSCAGKSYLGHRLANGKIQPPVESFRHIAWKNIDYRSIDRGLKDQQILQISFAPQWPKLPVNKINPVITRDSLFVLLLTSQEKLINQWSQRMKRLAIKTDITFETFKDKASIMWLRKLIYDDKDALYKLYLDSVLKMDRISCDHKFVYFPDRQEFIRIPVDGEQALDAIRKFE